MQNAYSCIQINLPLLALSNGGDALMIAVSFPVSKITIKST